MSTNLKYSDLQTFGQISAEQLSITGEYTLPIADGTANQILSTDGAGTVQFIDLSNLQIVTATNILNGTGINWTIVGLNVVQGDVTLAPFSTTDLAEGSNLYFTDERVDDRLSVLLQPGTTGSSPTVPLTWNYNDLANTLTPQISISAFTTDNLPQGSSNLYFSGELVDDRVALLLKPAITGTNPTNPIIWNYVDGLDSLTPQVSLAPFNTDALSEGATNLYFTDDRAIDAVGGALVNSATVTWNFNSILNTIEATASTGIAGLEIKLDGGAVATQPTLEFLTGSNVLLNAANDPINSKVTLEINSTLGGNLEDLNDVFFLSPGPQFEEVLYFNGAAWTSTDLESILPANYESITHADLKTKAIANDLVPNRMYLINDYETIYYMPGTSPQVEITGATEPLIVKAISVNELSPIAYSPSYPQDIIYYKLIPETGLRNVSLTNKGIIYYRCDAKERNSYPADFRNVECRRWDDGSGNFEVLSENGNSFVDYPIFGANCRDNRVESINPDFAIGYSISEDLPNVFLLANSIGNKFSAFTYGVTFGSTCSGFISTGRIPISIFRGPVSGVINEGIISASFLNAVSGLKVKAESTNIGVVGTTFNNSVTNCEFAYINGTTFSGLVEDSTLEYVENSSFDDTVSLTKVNQILNSIFNSTVKRVEGNIIDTCSFASSVEEFYFSKLTNVDFQDITNCSVKNIENTLSGLSIGSNFKNNVILAEFNENLIGNNFEGNNIGSSFNNNIIGNDFQNNKVGNNFTGNSIGTNATNNVMGDDFQDNNIGDYFAANIIGFAFNTNTIADYFSFNSIMEYFNNNTIGSDFQYNRIAGNFQNNNIGDNLQKNEIGNEFSTNIIGDDFQNNDIGNRFSNNTIGNSFTDNICLPRGLRLCTVGNGFTNNFVVTPITGVDFSLATHVYQVYNCKLFVRGGGTTRLSYVDATDTVIYAAVNA